MKKKKVEAELEYVGTTKVEEFTVIGRIRFKCPKCGHRKSVRLEMAEE